MIRGEIYFLFCIRKVSNMSNTYVKNYTNAFDIRGKEISVTAPARFDSDTDELIDDMELDNQAVKLAKKKFRQKYDYVDPKDIKELRKNWNLSQRNFAKVIGWSPSTIALYEAGEIPTVGNNRLLKVLIKNSSIMKQFIEESNKADKLDL